MSGKKRIRDAKTGQPLEPKAQPGYYPGFSTLAQAGTWDEATRVLIEKRVREIPELKFFTPEEARLLELVLETILPQSDRDEANRIPLLPFIDKRLTDKRFDGYLFEGTVEDDEAHRLGLKALTRLTAKPFAELDEIEREKVLDSIRRGEPGAGWDCGARLPAKHYWSVLLNDAVSAYYAHPLAWDEVGFGGPAYPRGYMRATKGLPEPWEKDEARYEWLAPEGSISDKFEDSENLYSGSGQTGRSGTH